MKYVEPEMEVIKLDVTVFTELTSGVDDGSTGNTVPEIGTM